VRREDAAALQAREWTIYPMRVDLPGLWTDAKRLTDLIFIKKLLQFLTEGK